MRNILFLLASLLIITACNKEEDPPAPVPSPGDENAIGSVPSTFTQKVLMEIFTGAGQPQCTDGFVKESEVLNAHPTQAIPVRIHFADGMEIPYYTTMESTFSNSTPPTFPSAMINRTPSLGTVILNRTQWMTNFNVAKNKTASCGLAMKTSLTGNQATVEVHAGFNQPLTGTYTLTVMLVEDNVIGTGNLYDQRNSYNTVTGHPYCNAGDPILGFPHMSTLRKVLTSDLGDVISPESLTSGGEYLNTYLADISAYDPAQLNIIAFITRTGTSATTYEVMNAQKVKMGSTQNWD